MVCDVYLYTVYVNKTLSVFTQLYQLVWGVKYLGKRKVSLDDRRRSFLCNLYPVKKEFCKIF